ncbi:MAG: DUF3990 domain-containing protein [Oscillospiraceae bacterium]|nr:DUF3990 domain-containing protein [Oscillospiraceae bacterium]
MSIEVYHGSNVVVEKPVIMPYTRPLDFGAGFYVTTYYDQAKLWSEKKAKRFKGSAIINKYTFDLTGLHIKEFKAANEEWIDFVVASRQSRSAIKHDYDVIKGEVADDMVFDSIALYIREIFTKERLIEELKTKMKNDQLCLATQKALERLSFTGVIYT